MSAYIPTKRRLAAVNSALLSSKKMDWCTPQDFFDRLNEEMKYKVCDHCGAHLDNGETCDCRNTNNDGGEPKDKQKERKNDNDGN